MPEKQVQGLADYSSLQSVLANTKLQTSNNPAFQLLKGLISNAQNSNTFIKQQFTDINGQQVSIQEGLQSVLNLVSSQNAQIAALADDIVTINNALVLIGNILADRNSAIYGASAYNSISQSLANVSEDIVNLDTDVFGSMRTGNTFVAPIAAQYLFCGQVAFQAAANGTRRVRISSSGGISMNVAEITPHSVDIVIASFSALVSLSGAETIQANILQDSGGPITAQGALQIFRVSYV